uniref:FAD dependent oxidoreductase domain-containing protein n=1 Tax=Falco tinnunculus TaxID=100819 RepID=A0A8C4U0H8_FALTI
WSLGGPGSAEGPGGIQREVGLRRLGQTLKGQLPYLGGVGGGWTPPGTLPDPRPPEQVDVVVVGGGVVGWSVAYWLKVLEGWQHGMRVLVVERDPMVRHPHPGAGFHVFPPGKYPHHLGVPNEPPVDIQFQPSGYLFLAASQDAAALEDTVRLQRWGTHTL